MNFSADTWWIFGLIFTGAIAIISFFLKRTINQTDDHEKSINEIKRTYVTKDEMKDLKVDLSKSIGKLQTDLEKCLTKQDFYQSISEIKEENKDQNKLIMELIKEGRSHGN